MIDNFAILVSCGLCLFFAIRAVLLDASLPWFGPEQPSGPDQEGAGDTPRSGRAMMMDWRARAAAARRRGSR
jgi:hypothetical protein